MKVSLYLLFLGIELCLGQRQPETCALTINTACTEKGGTCNKCKQDLFTYCASHKYCNPKKKNCKCSVNCKLNDEQCKEKGGTCTNYKKCKKLKKWFVCDKNMCGDGIFPEKYCACKYYKKQELCPQDSRCTAKEEGECITKKDCKKYAKKFPGYSCSKKLCEGNGCVCKYKKQPCKDNGCREKTEGECVSKDKCLEKAAIGMKCDENLCGNIGDESQCGCLYETCKKNSVKCKEKGGSCMSKEKCLQLQQLGKVNVVCDNTLCGGVNDDECTCGYKILTEPCKDNGCREKTEGECVSKDKCLEKKAMIGMKCDENLCGNIGDESQCGCLYETCKKNSVKCKEKGGSCMSKEKCLQLQQPGKVNVVCDNTLCGGVNDDDECTCGYKIETTLQSLNAFYEQNVFQKKTTCSTYSMSKYGEDYETSIIDGNWMQWGNHALRWKGYLHEDTGGTFNALLAQSSNPPSSNWPSHVNCADKTELNILELPASNIFTDSGGSTDPAGTWMCVSESDPHVGAVTAALNMYHWNTPTYLNANGSPPPQYWYIVGAVIEKVTLCASGPDPPHVVCGWDAADWTSGIGTVSSCSASIALDSIEIGQFIDLIIGPPGQPFFKSHVTVNGADWALHYGVGFGSTPTDLVFDPPVEGSDNDVLTLQKVAKESTKEMVVVKIEENGEVKKINVT